MSDTTYNGWTNYETWCVNLWLNNDSTIQWLWENEARHCWESAEATRYHTREDEASFELAKTLRLRQNGSINWPAAG